MTDKEIDRIFERNASPAPSEVDPAVLEQIAARLLPALEPVRPKAPAWIQAGALMAIGVALALAGAARAGLYGVKKMTDVELVLIFPALAVLLWLSARAYVAEMTPGSRRRIAPTALLVAGCAALLALFAALFHDYATTRFVATGVGCLRAGLLQAIPVALAGWLLLRRGYAVQPATAGLMGGALAGLAGVLMLEIHCPNFQVLHVMVWHSAVLPVGAAVGALLAWVARRRSA